MPQNVSHSSAPQIGISSGQIGQSSNVGSQFGNFGQFGHTGGQVFVAQPQEQYNSNNYRGFGRGRNAIGSRVFRDPCTICGRNNHTTNFYYYRP